MDTDPENSKTNQVAASSTKFEDSPIFSFLDNLSPIKPVKSMHITQTINPLSFPSLPSDFTSPDCNSLEESRFIRRYQLSDPSKPEFSSDDPSTIDTNKINSDDNNNMDEQKENLDENFHNSNCDLRNCSQKGGDSRINHNKNATSCDWESLISDASNGLVFESPSDESLIKSTSFNSSIRNDNPSEKMEYEHLSLNRGMRKRCLVYEMMGAHIKNSDDNSNSKASKIDLGNHSLPCVLPVIGLHLNALVTTPKGIRIGNKENAASGRILIGPGKSFNFPPPARIQETSNNISDTFGSGVLPLEDASVCIGNEETNQSSPKKKRRRSEDDGACKRCNCKKSKCLKLYCECFAAGVYCVEPCLCIDCFNQPIHEETVLATRKQIESRNPLAFAPKVIKALDSSPEIADESNNTPASARHKRGCNCRKSGCLKKYCECYQGGVGCSINCRCEGCKNVFGRKEGMEAEFQEDETDMTNDLEQITDSVPPTTPFRRPHVQHPFSANKKPLRSSLPCIGSSSAVQGLNANNYFETINEDEIPEFLQTSPQSNVVKSCSPNGKRVSPPQMRNSRKLILKSIPSFPSFTPNR